MMGGNRKPAGGDPDRRTDPDHRPGDENHGTDRQEAGAGHVHGPGCGCGHDHAGHVHEASTGSERGLPDFPTEVVFKAVFRNKPYTIETLKSVCREAGIDAIVSDRESRNGTFISYTITAVFPSEEVLKAVCSRVGAIEGFYTMF
jgi:hypothetical protein